MTQHDKYTRDLLDLSQRTAMARWPAVALCGLAFVFGLGAYIEGTTHYIGKLVGDFVYDNVNHYTPCSNLPTVADVKSIMRAHQDAIDRIIQVNPWSVEIDIGPTSCPDTDKADLIIYYQSHADRVGIEAVIGSSTFFGIPYRLRNT